LLLCGCQNGPKLENPRPEDFKVTSRQAIDGSQRTSPITSGEVLDVYVIEDPSLNHQYSVRAEGHIIFPGMGRVIVAGLTPEQAELRLKQLLEARKLKTATVLLDRVYAKSSPLSATTDQLLVYLTGKVTQPGQHALTVDKTGSMGVYESIMVSGGFARFASPQKSYVLRKDAGTQNKRKIAVDLKAIADGDIPDLPLRMGDIIFVPEKTFGF
jgi:polysaccharide export outer membrane protein